MKTTEIIKMVKAGTLRESHTATKRGYVSRKLKFEELNAAPYDGKFGKGFTVDSARYDSTQYCYITYYLYN